MKIKPKTHRWPSQAPRHIISLLSVLGLDYRRTHKHKPGGRKASFWQRCESDLPHILHDAWKAFRRKAMVLHPDKPSGSNRAFAYLSSVWDRIELLFQRKGIRL